MPKKNVACVPIVPYGLRHEETIIQILLALNQLNCIVEDVFHKIGCNIEKQKTSLAQLQQRNVLIQRKIKMLEGKHVATTVYADSKFPSLIEEECDESDDDKDDECNSYGYGYNCYYFERPLIIPAREAKYLGDTTLCNKRFYRPYKVTNKLQFFHVKTDNSFQARKDFSVKEGLGKLPIDFESVNSLVLFNTCENLYRNYILIDPLNIVIKDQDLISDENDSKTETIAAAPRSILDSNFTVNQDYLNYAYTPAFQEVPSLDVPQDLPDLPGVAADLRFLHKAEKPFAPSVFANSKAAKRNSFSDDFVSNTDKPPENGNLSVTNNELITQLNSTEIPYMVNGFVSEPQIPKVLPPTELDVSHLSTTAQSLSLSSSLTVHTPPPPPPPPPLPPPMPPVQLMPTQNKTENRVQDISDGANISSTTTKSNKQINDLPSIDVHANLMEAIRKAGGKEKAKLRPVIDGDDGILQSTNSKSNNGFMVDLYAKLALRRKGISGQIKENKNTNFLDQISAMIPPSPPDDSDDDAEDSNEWDD